jgi:tartrate dehydrogenase/decarboxylase / D-malate dehydrogenase
MMLEHLGEGHAAGEVMSAIGSVTVRGIGTVAGKDRTEAITQAVLAALC